MSLPEPDGITTARLNGTAHRVLREHLEHDAAVAELHAITRDPRTLGWAAGTALGAFRVEQTWNGDRVAQLLLDAGGDPQVCETQAAANEARMRVDHGRPGIGMPS